MRVGTIPLTIQLPAMAPISRRIMTAVPMERIFSAIADSIVFHGV